MVQLWGSHIPPSLILKSDSLPDPPRTLSQLPPSRVGRSSQEYTFDCTATYNVAYIVGGVNFEHTVKDLAISFPGGTSFSDRRRSTFQQFLESHES